MTALQILATALALAVVLVTLCAVALALHFARVKPQPGLAAIVGTAALFWLSHRGSERDRHDRDLAELTERQERLEAKAAADRHDAERLEHDVAMLARWAVELHARDGNPAPSHVVQRSMEMAPDHVRELMRAGFTHREVRWLERIAARARQRAAGIDPGPLRSGNR